MVNTMAITRETYEKSHDFFACFRLVYDVNEQSFGNLEQSRSISGSRRISGKITNIQSCAWSLAFVYTIVYNYVT